MTSFDRACPPHLLVVDDDPLLRGMATRTLQHAGFGVTAVASGEAAIERFSAGDISLVLLDVQMPGIDGHEVCRRLRALPLGQALPILMLTGSSDAESIESAYQAGATDFITKPIPWVLLAQRVRYALRAAEVAAREARSRERFERAQHLARLGSWEISPDGQRMTCTHELAVLFGAPPDAPVCPTPQAFLDRVDPSARESVAQARQQALADGMPYQITYAATRFDGANITVHEQALPIRDAAGRLHALEGITQDVSERVEAARQISRLSHFDTITGLPNRAYFDELAEPILERTARLGTQCALLHVDIDQFKAINDALGRAGGDRVLQLLAQRLRDCVRVSDLAVEGAGGEACVGRVGANSFTLLLADVGDDCRASAIAERLLRAVALPFQALEREFVLSASVGVALFPRDAKESRQLARCAEQALYEAKRAGRGQQRFFDEAMNARASQRLALESDLRRAIADDQLRLYYQPKVDAAQQRVIGAEALVRWQHPLRGLLPPAEFIAQAEASGLIGGLTDWVISNACAHLARRRANGLTAAPVSVNVASVCFSRPGWAGSLRQLLRDRGVDPSMLVIEVTESVLLQDDAGVLANLQALRDGGFRVSLDDFGTGYSALGYLTRFPIDELKIDRSFIREIGDGVRQSAIARSIIALGREFGLDVVAEGVETAEQSEFLRAHGCGIQQGFLFARPMSQAQYEQLLDGLAATPGIGSAVAGVG